MKNKMVVLICLVFLMIASIGFSYAFFATQFEGNETAKNISTSSSLLKLIYNDGSAEIALTDIEPGDTFNKTITVSNVGTETTYYSLIWSNLINTFTNDEMIVSATCTSYSDYDNKTISGTCPNFNDVVIPYNEIATDTNIKKGITINTGIVHEYQFEIEFIETNELQNYNQNKTFNAKLGVVEASKPVEVLTAMLRDNVAYADNVASPYVSYDSGIDFGTKSGFFDYAPVLMEENKSVNITDLYYVGDYTFDVDDGNFDLTNYSKKAYTSEHIGKASCLGPNKSNCVYLYIIKAVDNGAITSVDIYDSQIDVNGERNGLGLYYTDDIDVTDENNDGLGKRVYYYRGEVDNNYLSFAGYCWRIVRTNENDSVRIIFYSNYVDGKCEEDFSNVLGSYGFNPSNFDNAYFGYMYGTVGATSYIDTHANNVNSDVKNVVDSWYENNILTQGTNITSKIANTIYCNDRYIIADDQYEEGEFGYSTYESYYNTYKRITSSATFKCRQKNDQFTLSVVTGGSEEYGNNSLKYPIALLTIDEVIYAGGSHNEDNSEMYLYYGPAYWTMSPAYYSNTGNVGIVGGRLGKYYTFSAYSSLITQALPVVPVISLNNKALVIDGNGTINNPYFVE